MVKKVEDSLPVQIFHTLQNSNFFSIDAFVQSNLQVRYNNKAAVI